jgi:hypothetical protein
MNKALAHQVESAAHLLLLHSRCAHWHNVAAIKYQERRIARWYRRRTTSRLHVGQRVIWTRSAWDTRRMSTVAVTVVEIHGNTVVVQVQRPGDGMYFRRLRHSALRA